MDDVLGIVFLLIGLVIGVGAVYAIMRNRSADAERRGRQGAEGQIATLSETVRIKEQQLDENRGLLQDIQRENITLGQENSKLREQVESERRIAMEKLALLNDAQDKLSNAFKALSAEALNTNNKMFLDLAKESLDKYQEKARTDLEERQKNIDLLVKPLKESLEKVEIKIGEIEKSRIDSYATLTEQVKSMATTQAKLQSETGNLVKALRAPTVRGRWGEIQLRRVVELAGMVDYCDFQEQQTVQTEDGKLRPDMVIKLPNKKTVVVDSKVPLSAYLESLEASDEECRVDKLCHHATLIRKHVDALSGKSYWAQLDCTPEFVVMFMPGEVFFSAALEKDPELIEYGARNKVIIATPTTLIAVLKSVAYGWSQEHIAEHAQEVKDLGVELYERVLKFTESFAKCGKDLGKAVDSYNKAVSTFEGRVLVSTRRFKELEVTTEEAIEELDPIQKEVRQVQTQDDVTDKGND